MSAKQPGKDGSAEASFAPGSGASTATNTMTATSSVVQRRKAAAMSPTNSGISSPSLSVLEGGSANGDEPYHRDSEGNVSASANDVDGAREEEQVPFTLMDEVVLLGLKDRKGYVPFLNDSISYVLRGCILMELALRRRIKVIRESKRRPFPDRIIEVVDSSNTGEVLLDEALRLIKMEKQSVAGWLDLLSGETWNPMKVNYQLKQVRERVAKGLVDKGVLRTEKHTFLFFDMATHPLSNPSTKDALIKRIMNTCLGRGSLPSLRSVALVCAASTANVLENALISLPQTEREAAFTRAEEFLRDYSAPSERSSSITISSASEIIAGVLTVFCRLDSLLY